MTANELVKELESLIKRYGDLDVYDTQLDLIKKVIYIDLEKSLEEGFYLNCYYGGQK